MKSSIWRDRTGTNGCCQRRGWMKIMKHSASSVSLDQSVERNTSLCSIRILLMIWHRHRDWVKLKYKTQQLRVISVCQRLTCRICLGLKHKNGRWRSRSTTGRSASSLEGSSMRRGLRLNTWGKTQKYSHYIFIRHLTDQSVCEGSSPRAAVQEEGWAPVTT